MAARFSRPCSCRSSRNARPNADASWAERSTDLTPAPPSCLGRPLHHLQPGTRRLIGDRTPPRPHGAPCRPPGRRLGTGLHGGGHEIGRLLGAGAEGGLGRVGGLLGRLGSLSGGLIVGAPRRSPLAGRSVRGGWGLPSALASSLGGSVKSSAWPSCSRVAGPTPCTSPSDARVMPPLRRRRLMISSITSARTPASSSSSRLAVWTLGLATGGLPGGCRDGGAATSRGTGTQCLGHPSVPSEGGGDCSSVLPTVSRVLKSGNGRKVKFGYPHPRLGKKPGPKARLSGSGRLTRPGVGEDAGLADRKATRIKLVAWVGAYQLAGGRRCVEGPRHADAAGVALSWTAPAVKRILDRVVA